MLEEITTHQKAMTKPLASTPVRPFQRQLKQTSSPTTQIRREIHSILKFRLGTEQESNTEFQAGNTITGLYGKPFRKMAHTLILQIVEHDAYFQTKHAPKRLLTRSPTLKTLTQAK